MIDLALVATRDRDLYEEVQRELVDPREPISCRSVGPRVRTIVELQERVESATLIVIHASLPLDGASSNGETGMAVLQFLRELRSNGSTIPIIVLLPHPMEEIESHCVKSRFDYGLTVRDFSHESLKTALQRLGVFGVSQEAHDYAIEIKVESRFCHVELLRDGKSVREKECFHRNPMRMPMYAQDFRDYKMLRRVEHDGLTRMLPSPNWLNYFKTVGDMLYDDLIRSVLNDDLESIQSLPDGLTRVHVRFHVANDLFAIPFEVLYDSRASRFLCVVSPIVRRLAAAPIRAANTKMPEAHDLNVLFIKAQVEGKWTLVDQSDQSIVEQEVFEHLSNLDAEESYFREIEDKRKGTGRIAVTFLTQPDENLTFAETLQKRLNEDRYDFVHFAGHAFTSKDGRTFLITPSARPDRVVGIPIQAFARWAGGAGVVFAYLSSCRGGSWEGVRNMVEHGVPQVLGFRWDVQDDMAADFAKVFYDNLFDDKSFAAAYRNACVKLHDDFDSTDPTWASPVMIMQGEDWWRQAA